MTVGDRESADVVRWMAPGDDPPVKPLVMFLGNVRRGEYESLHERGFRIGLLRDVAAAGTVRLTDLDVVVKHDFGRPAEDLVGVIAALSRIIPIAGILNMRENYVEHHAYLGRRLWFGAPPSHLTDLVLSKPAMRRAFETQIGDRSTVRFADVGTQADIAAFGDRCGYPLILKPSRLYSSLFVAKLERPEDIAPVFGRVSSALTRYCDARGLPASHRGLHVEEFIAGSNHSIDCFVTRDGRVTTTPVIDVLTGADIGLPDFHHFARLLPSRVPRAMQAEMAEMAVHAVRAVGLSSAVAHVEFILGADGAKLLELAARPGGNRSRLLAAAFGLDLVGAYLDLSLGRRPALQPRFERPFGIVTPFPRRPGRYAGLLGEDRMTSLPSYRWHDVSVPPGTPVGTVGEGQKAFVSIELAAERMADLERDVDRLAAMPDLIALEHEGSVDDDT
jgi:ATP-grasp domain